MGVNQPLTQPRIHELSQPFAYHAACIRQMIAEIALSLGNSSFTEGLGTTEREIFMTKCGNLKSIGLLRRLMQRKTTFSPRIYYGIGLPHQNLQLYFQHLKDLLHQQIFKVSNASPVFTSTGGRCTKFCAEALTTIYLSDGLHQELACVPALTF